MSREKSKKDQIRIIEAFQVDNEPDPRKNLMLKVKNKGQQRSFYQSYQQVRESHPIQVLQFLENRISLATEKPKPASHERHEQIRRGRREALNTSRQNMDSSLSNIRKKEPPKKATRSNQEILPQLKLEQQQENKDKVYRIFDYDQFVEDNKLYNLVSHAVIPSNQKQKSQQKPIHQPLPIVKIKQLIHEPFESEEFIEEDVSEFLMDQRGMRHKNKTHKICKPKPKGKSYKGKFNVKKGKNRKKKKSEQF